MILISWIWKRYERKVLPGIFKGEAVSISQHLSRGSPPSRIRKTNLRRASPIHTTLPHVQDIFFSPSTTCNDATAALYLRRPSLRDLQNSSEHIAVSKRNPKQKSRLEDVVYVFNYSVSIFIFGERVLMRWSFSVTFVFLVSFPPIDSENFQVYPNGYKFGYLNSNNGYPVPKVQPG